MSFQELINLALKALKQSIDEEMTKENIRISYVKSTDKQFRICSRDEIKAYIDGIV